MDKYIIIDTHPIRNVSLESMNSEIMLMTSYFVHIREFGVMCIIVSSTGQTALVALNRTQSENYHLPFGLSSGRYTVLAYDIGRDGLLPIPQGNVLYPAVTREHDITRSDQGMCQRRLCMRTFWAKIRTRNVCGMQLKKSAWEDVHNGATSIQAASSGFC